MNKKYADLPENEKKELVERAYQLGYEYEAKCGNCPQCVLATIQEVFGGIDNAVFKASFGLGAGVGGTSKGNCGALCGAVMAISAFTGREREHFQDGKAPKCQELSRRIIQKFEEQYGGILCHQVQTKIFGQSYDLTVPEQYKAFIEDGGHVDKCTAVVGNAARWVAEMIVDGDLE